MAAKRREHDLVGGGSDSDVETQPMMMSQQPAASKKDPHHPASTLHQESGGNSTSGENGVGEVVIDKQSSEWTKFLQFLGPGILVAAVYVDPGQIVVDMESGSVFGYKLLWACLLANLMGFMFQHLCSRLSIVTGRNLAEENRLEYPMGVRFFLWLTVELASIAADVGYVMGTATALSILFNIELHWGVLITGLDTFLALGLQFWGIRKVELLMGVFFTLIICCYLVEVTQIRPPLLEILDGFLPRLYHRNSRYGYGTYLELLCANLGAAVCPPNFFLQSALVMTRRVDRTEGEIRSAFKHNLTETALCLGIATVINMVMLILAGTVFFPERVVSLEQGAKLMEQTMGSTTRGAFAVAMLCAGQSSSLSGVLSTQYIMEGFFQMTIPSWIIRLITRIIAIVPAFYIVFSFGPDSAAELIEQAQVVVNFVVPFTVIPLTKFLSSELKMGQYRLSSRLRLACWAGSLAAIVLNLMAMCQTIMGLFEGNDLLMWIVLITSVSLYAGMSLYLMNKEVEVGPSTALPPVLNKPEREREGVLWLLRQIRVKYWVGGAVLAAIVAALMWVDILSPRYSSIAGF